MIGRFSTAILQRLAQTYPLVAVTGPRQSGKTTLCKNVFAAKPYVSLEDLDERAFANEDPRGFLARFPAGAILDEVQHCPKLLSYLQTRVDAHATMGEFVLTGSANLALHSHISQSLAGRVGMLHLLPFTGSELAAADRAPQNLDQLLFQGLYPVIYDRQAEPTIWYNNYLATYIERDVRQLTTIRDLHVFQRFLKLCAARTGQLLNMSSLAADCGISSVTIKHWLTLLEASYIIFLLTPYHENFGKRLTKMPKLYFIDTGLAATLLNIQTAEQLSTHASRAALFETWVVSTLLKCRYNKGLAANTYFWRDQKGLEIDVLLDEGNALHPIEIKSGQTIADEFSNNLRKWQSLSASTLATIIYGGQQTYTRQKIRYIDWQTFMRHELEPS
jgi:uncharacterized protein